MSPRRNDEAPRVTSKAFSLWKIKENAEGRKITQDSIIEATGLSKMTVRRYLEPNGDISGSPLSSAAVFARYFGVSIGEVVEMEAGSDAELDFGVK